MIGQTLSRAKRLTGKRTVSVCREVCGVRSGASMTIGAGSLIDCDDTHPRRTPRVRALYALTISAKPEMATMQECVLPVFHANLTRAASFALGRHRPWATDKFSHSLVKT